MSGHKLHWSEMKQGRPKRHRPIEVVVIVVVEVVSILILGGHDVVDTMPGPGGDPYGIPRQGPKTIPWNMVKGGGPGGKEASSIGGDGRS